MKSKTDLKSSYQSLGADLGQSTISEFPHLKYKVVGYFQLQNADFKNESTPE